MLQHTEAYKVEPPFFIDDVPNGLTARNKINRNT